MTKDEAAELLEGFRVQVDDVDRRIVALLNERTRVVEEIGRVKRESGLPIYEPKREEQVFENIVASNGGPLTAGALRRVFERIIDESRIVQRLRMQAQKENR
jgi:chorismate mutase-like protein